jgi:hypothetical protein
MGHQIFDRFTFNGFPSARDSEDKTPGAIWVIGVALKNHLHIGL